LTAQSIRANQAERLAAMPAGAWACNTLGNHDSPRLMSRFYEGSHRTDAAKAYLTMLLTLKGTPVLYYGEEIGMSDCLFNDLCLFRDPLSIQNYQMEKGCEGAVKRRQSLLVRRGAGINAAHPCNGCQSRMGVSAQPLCIPGCQ